MRVGVVLCCVDVRFEPAFTSRECFTTVADLTS